MKKTGTVTAPPVKQMSVKVSDEDELEVRVLGKGTPVVLVHGAIFGSLLRPVAEELAAQHQAIWYRRRGHNGTPTRPVAVEEQARDVVKVLDALGIDQAHVVGHSAGGLIALALAIEAPERLLSAAFFDSILTQVPSAGVLAEVARPAVMKAQAGDFEGAATAFLEFLGCSKELMDRTMPGAWAELRRDAPTWFQADLPMLDQWSPDLDAFAAIEVPCAWAETGTVAPIHETGQLLRRHRPDMAVLRLPDHHFFPVTAPKETAAAISGWIEDQ